MALFFKGMIPWNKGTAKPKTLKVRKASSTSFKKGQKPWNKGIIYSKEMCNKLSVIRKGIIPTKEAIKKRSEALPRGKDSHQWKGDNATYRVIHRWAERWVGKAKQCGDCGKTEGRIHLANKDHKYKREINDWISLCPKCHGKYDKIKGLRKRRST